MNHHLEILSGIQVAIWGFQKIINYRKMSRLELVKHQDNLGHLEKVVKINLIVMVIILREEKIICYAVEPVKIIDQDKDQLCKEK